MTVLRAGGISNCSRRTTAQPRSPWAGLSKRRPGSAASSACSTPFPIHEDASLHAPSWSPTMTETCVTRARYEDLIAGFDWSIGERELGYVPGDPINIGWHCSDRICRQGRGSHLALVWEDFRGTSRTYSFDDLRVLSNTFATFLQGLGLSPGERVCLFLDRVPELYIGFLAILKMGGIAQPLFSAFAEDSLWTRLENAGTAAIITQKKHLPKVRRIGPRLPNLRHVIVVDAEALALSSNETALTLDREVPVRHFDVFPSLTETPSVLHYTSGTTC